MKIEKITENKLRVVLNIDDLETNNIDFDSVVNNAPETQTLILSILNQAEKEVGFYTQDCKILIEAFSSFEGNFVFTITKTPTTLSQNSSFTRKTSKPKKKSFKLDSPLIYSFQTFDDFCEFCRALHIEILTHENLKFICKNTALYFYNDMYYLLISDINKNCEYLNTFFLVISEFTDKVSNYKNLDAKLSEYGKPIFKKNAISNTIDIFVR